MADRKSVILQVKETIKVRQVGEEVGGTIFAGRLLCRQCGKE